MVNNDINFSLLTACGECCVGCKKKIDGLCEGCIESNGKCKEWAQTGYCPIYACAKLHNVQFCGICAEFPCSELTSKIYWRCDIVEHLTGLAKIYNKQLAKK